MSRGYRKTANDFKSLRQFMLYLMILGIVGWISAFIFLGRVSGAVPSWYTVPWLIASLVMWVVVIILIRSYCSYQIRKRLNP